MLCPFTAVAEPSDFTVNYGHSQPVEICPYSSALNPEAAWPLASLVHPLTAPRAHAGLATTDRTSHCWRHLELWFLRDTGRAFPHEEAEWCWGPWEERQKAVIPDTQHGQESLPASCQQQRHSPQSAQGLDEARPQSKNRSLPGRLDSPRLSKAGSLACSAENEPGARGLFSSPDSAMNLQCDPALRPRFSC